MPRACTVCAHAERQAIDKALVAGEAFRNIAQRFGTSVAALHRHKGEHLPRLLAKAQRQEVTRATALEAQAHHQAADERAHALDVVQQLRTINGAALTVLVEARNARNGDLALKAIDRIQRQIELQAKLLGELDERPQVNVLIMPEWVALRAVIVAALAPYPEARLVVAEALDAAG